MFWTESTNLKAPVAILNLGLYGQIYSNFIVSSFSYLKVLAHRLGLIPIYADPREFDVKMDGKLFRRNLEEHSLLVGVERFWNSTMTMLCIDFSKGDEEAKDDTTLQFDLKVKCIKNKNAPKNATDPDELYVNSKGNSKYINKLIKEV